MPTTELRPLRALMNRLPVDCLLAAACVTLLVVGICAQKAPDVRLDVGSAPGAAQSGMARIAASGSSVYVLWEDQRNSSSTFNAPRDLYANRSLDGGATWLAPDVRVDNGDPPGAFDSRNASIACVGPMVYAAWLDSRAPVGLYFNRSTDAGATWATNPVTIDPGGGYASKVLAHGDSVYLVWSRASELYFNRSLDRGVTWLPTAVRVDHGLPPGYVTTRFTCALSGQSVFVAWEDQRNGFVEDIYFNRSLDGGTTWLPTDTRLDTGTPPGAARSYFPMASAEGSKVFVVWYEASGSSTTVRFNRSLDGGTTWLPVDTRIDHPLTSVGNSPLPQIASSGNSVYVAWTDQRNGVTPTWNRDIYFNRSLDAGASWLPNDVRLDTGSALGAVFSDRLVLGCSGSSVFAAWYDQLGFSSSGVFWNRSFDGGGTWLPSATRLEQSGTAATPAIAASGSSAYVAWHDWRNGVGTADIYFTLASGYQPYGNGTPGSAAWTPGLTGAGQAAIGGSILLRVSQGLGGAPGVLVAGVGASSAISMPLFGGELLVTPTTSALFVLPGAPGTPGAGRSSISLPVPNQPSLLGFNANFQALILDAGAPQGVAMSNGLAAWIG